MNQPFHARCQLHKRPELRDPGYRPLHHRARMNRLHHLYPRIAQRLLQPQRHPLLLRVDPQDHGLHLVPHLHDVRRLSYLLAPGNLADVDQPFHSRRKLHERAKIHLPRHRSHDLFAQVKPLRHRIPRVWLQLL